MKTKNKLGGLRPKSKNMGFFQKLLRKGKQFPVEMSLPRLGQQDLNNEVDNQFCACCIGLAYAIAQICSVHLHQGIGTLDQVYQLLLDHELTMNGKTPEKENVGNLLASLTFTCRNDALLLDHLIQTFDPNENPLIEPTQNELLFSFTRVGPTHLSS